MRQDDGVFRLLYVSCVTPETFFAFDAVMRDILLASHRLNRRDAITGLLIAYEHWFAQVLEGEEAAVEACFARIVRDSRHTEVIVRLRSRAPERMFERWSMCGLTLSPMDDALLRRPDIEFNPWSASPEALLQILAGVADRHGAELDQQHAALGAESGGAAKSDGSREA